MKLSRRAFVRYATVLSASVFNWVALADSASTRVQPENERQVSFRWRVPTVHSKIVENSLVFDGSIEKESETKGLPLIFIFVGVALLPSLVDAILTLRRKLVQPGLKIDARLAEIKIEVDSALPSATILIVDKSGAKLYEPDQLTDPADLVKAITGAMSK